MTMINYTSPLLLVYKPPRGVWFKDDAAQAHVDEFFLGHCWQLGDLRESLTVVGLINLILGSVDWTICRTTTIFHGKVHGKKHI